MSWQSEAAKGLIDISGGLINLAVDVAGYVKDEIEYRYGDDIKVATNKAKEYVKNNIIQTEPRKPITFLPNFELLAHTSCPKYNITIESLLEKYSIDGFSEKFNAFPEEIKAEFFIKINNILCAYRDEYDGKISSFPWFYIEKAIKLIPDKYNYSDNLYESYKSGLPKLKRDKFNKDEMSKTINRILNIKINKKNDFKKDNCENHCYNGDSFFNEGNFDKARIEYQKAYRGESRKIEYLTRCLFINQEIDYTYKFDVYKKIIDAQKLCLDLDDYRFLPLFLVMASNYCFVNGFNLNLCEVFCEAAIYILEFFPNLKKFAAPYYMLARVYETKGKYEKTIELFEKSSQIDTEYVIEADIKRVGMLIKRGENFCKEEAEAHADYANTLYRRKLYDEAMKEFSLALEYNPNSKAALEGFCDTAYDKGRFYDLKRAVIHLGGLCFVYRMNSTIWNDQFVYYYFAKCCKHENAYDKEELYSMIINQIIERNKDDEFGGDSIDWHIWQIYKQSEKRY